VAAEVDDLTGDRRQPTEPRRGVAPG
jgi:hypothetical protein